MTGRVKRVVMAEMAKMGEYWGNGQGVPKQRGEESCNVVVLFRAWLQRSGSSLGEVVGRVEVEETVGAGGAGAVGG